MTLKVKVKQDVPVKWLVAEMGVRYWEDATVNGIDETHDDPKIPLRDGDVWKIKIDLENGVIVDWPKGVTAETYYKVCDAGAYTLMRLNGDTVAKREWYVPSMLAPSGKGYGDYVILKIDGDGVIENFKADLSFFEEDED